MNHSIDQRLQQAFADIEPGRLSPEFQDQLMQKLAAGATPVRTLSIAWLLPAYWLLSAVLMVVVLAQITWLDLQWTATAVVVSMTAVALTAMPLVFFALKLKISIADLIWNTLGE